MDVLSKQEIEKMLGDVPGWKFADNHIGKEFQLNDFKSALTFVNKIGDEAEKMDHHPDILIHSWNKVKVTISTHSAGGVTQNDFNLAKKIEGLES